jgi:polysaccharide deacetylase family protein (PEP-CTERM system associated)
MAASPCPIREVPLREPTEEREINVLSIDVEDYFHVSAFSASVAPSDWDLFPSRVERNVGRVLNLLRNHNAKATFFVLGYVARRFPKIVRQIADEGHEIGSHGLRHQRIHHQTPQEFRSDIRAARDILTEQVQRPVACYRAPSFSIVKNTRWAMDVLVEEGFEIDSSIFPVHHDLYGMPDASRFPSWNKTPQGYPLFEFPPSSVRIAGNNWGVGGGGYLRILPYSFTRWALTRINRSEGQPGMVYFHPWEIDPDQPRIPAGLRSRFRHYTNLSEMESKLERLLLDFRFDTLTGVSKTLEAFKSRDVNVN